MSDSEANIAAALALGECATQVEWVARYPGVHCWFGFHGMTACANCSVIRRDDLKNKPCRGIVDADLR